MTELIYGAKNGILEQVKQQLRHGVDVNFQDLKDGATALYWAACSGHSAVISVLLDAAAKVDIDVKWGSTALHAAADRGNVECMKLLLEHAADPNIQNQNGDSPLHLAAYRGHDEACMLLLDFKVDISIPNKAGKNATQEAESGKHFELAKTLEQKSKGRVSASYPQYLPNHKVAVRTGSANSDQEIKRSYKFNVAGGADIDSLTRTDAVFGDSKDFMQVGASRIALHKTFSAPTSPSEKSASSKHKEGGSPDDYLYAMQVSNQDTDGVIYELQFKLAIAESEKDALKSKISDAAEKKYFESSSVSPDIGSCTLQRVKNELIVAKRTVLKLEQKNKQLENILAKSTSGQKSLSTLNNLSSSPDDHVHLPRNVASESKAADFGLQLIKALSLVGTMFSAKATNLFPIMSTVLHDVSSMTIKLYQVKLLDQLKSGKASIKKCRSYKLDKPGQVWTMGHQYKLVHRAHFSKTINFLLTGHNSVAFEIIHQNKKYIMKVMPNQPVVPPFNFGGNEQQSGMQSFNPVRNEQEVLLRLLQHPNLVSVLHHYEQPLRKLDVNLSHLHDFNTTMAVMPHYLMSLRKLVQIQNQNPSVPFALSESFYLRVLLQILRALAHLLDNNIAHRDIKPDCVYITEGLRVVLGGFRMAMKLTGPNDQPILFVSSSQIGAGNPMAWTPEFKKWERDGPPASWERKVTLMQVYESSDIYNIGRMIFSLMKPDIRQEPQSTPNVIAHHGTIDWKIVPAGYSKSFTDLLQEMFANNANDRPTVREAILRTCMLLYGPKVDELQSQHQCDLWVMAQCSRLVAQMPDLSDKSCDAMTTEELAHALDWELRTDYLTDLSENELWQLICSLQCRTGVRKETNT